MKKADLDKMSLDELLVYRDRLLKNNWILLIIALVINIAAIVINLLDVI